MSGHLSRAAKGVDFDDAAALLDDIVTGQSNAAYSAARADAQSFDLRPVINKYRSRGSPDGDSGDIASTLNKAINLFFKPGMVSGNRGPRYTRFEGVINDVPRYLAKRQELDQMIATSYSNNRPTPLTRQLTQLRSDLNNTVKAANPKLAEADAKFAGGMGGKDAMKLGERTPVSDGPMQRGALAKFAKMTEEQKELYRLGVVQNMFAKINNKADGADMTTQFSRRAVRSYIERIFPKDRADRLIRDIDRDGITTETLRDVFSGSRTAPLLKDMEQLGSDAQLAASFLTGNVPATFREVTKRVAHGIGSRQSTEIMKILTDTDPKALLPVLDEIIASARKLNRGDVAKSLLSKTGGAIASQELASGRSWAPQIEDRR